MRLVIDPSAGHFRGEFLSGGSVGADTEHRIMQRLAHMLQSQLSEYRIESTILPTEHPPGLSLGERNTQGFNTLILKLALEKSPKLDPVRSMVTIRHNGLPERFLKVFDAPLISWSNCCVVGRQSVAQIENYSVESESLVLQIIPFRYWEFHSEMFASRLEALAHLLCMALYSQQPFLDLPRRLPPKTLSSSLQSLAEKNQESMKKPAHQAP